MELKRFFWIASSAALFTASQTFRLDFPMPLAASSVVAQTIDERQAEAYKLREQGLQQIYAGQPRAALPYFQEALVIYREIKDRQREGQTLGNLGLAYLQLGEYGKATEYFQQDLAIAREINDKVGEGQALGNLGLAYSSQGDDAKAVEYFEQSLAIARAVNDQQGEGNALGNLGLIYEAQGEYDKAIDYYQQVLALAEQMNNPLSEISALFILGNTYVNWGQYTQAIEYLQHALVISREIKNKEFEWQTLLGIGGAFVYLGEYAKAIDYFQQSLAIARETKDPSSEGFVLNAFGNTYVSLGDYIQAIDYFEQSLAIARAIKNSQLEAAATAGLGTIFAFLGDYDTAINYLKQGVSLAQKVKDLKTEATSWGNLGSAYLKSGEYIKAIECFEQSLVIVRTIKDREGEGRTLGNLGSVYLDLREYPKAIEHFQQDLEIAREIGNLPGQGRALNNLGLAHFKSGNLTEAEKILRLGMKARESLRGLLEDNDSWKVLIFEEQARTYDLLQRVLIARNKTDEALEISERGRTQAFVELLRRRLTPPSETPQPINYPKIEDIKKVAQQQNATLVEYSVISPDELYIWVISPHGKVTFRQIDLKFLGVTADSSTLRKLVNETLESLGVGEDRNGIFEVTLTTSAPDPQRQTQSLKQLHQLLIQPIADLLPSNSEDRVIFIPHRDLFRVPFPALMDSDGKYLVEKHTILTAPSIQVLELTREQRQRIGTRSDAVPGNNALIVGNPNPMPSGFSPLKGAEKEALAVAQLLNTEPLIGSQATEPAITQKLPNARIIHLATHGTFNEQQPLLGGIALAPTGNEPHNDGLLTAEEIFALNEAGKLTLNAELLILSACNTGRGRITGDGVIGLSRSFISAGVPSVLVSLWSVPDAPTAELMTEFYANFYGKNLDKAQSLRQAMLAMMEKHRDNPRAWAAFTLIGEAE